MKQAIVAVEDKRFFEHHGIDLTASSAPSGPTSRNQKVVQGGSTITQQFIKNAFIGQQRSFGRKLKEAALAWQLEQQWPKDRILTAYLNTIYFGNGAYGIEQAAQVYFGEHRLALSLSQAALLAGIPSDPTQYDPVTHPRLARARRAVAAAGHARPGGHQHDQYRLALAAPLPRPQAMPPARSQGPAPYFTNYVKQLLVDRYGTARTFGGGLQVRTSIDLDLQDIARETIAKWLPSNAGPSAALVAIDPRDGRVLAMYGGRSFQREPVQPRRAGRAPARVVVQAVRARRRAAAGDLAATTFVSGPVTISLDTGKVWHVHNYEGSNLGTIDLESATIHSDNTVYAQLANIVGPQAIANTARNALGITSHLDPLLLDRARRRGGQPARDGPRVLVDRERRPADRRVDLRQPTRGRSCR